MATEEEIIAAGKLLGKAYYIGRDYGEDRAWREADGCTYRIEHAWAQQAKALESMGYPIPGGTGALTGRSIDGASLLRAFEQQLENARATLEGLEKAAEPNRKLIAQWRWVVNALGGAEGYKKGFLAEFKDAGPGSY